MWSSEMRLWDDVMCQMPGAVMRCTVFMKPCSVPTVSTCVLVPRK